jgi:hypothetical protein
VRSSSSRPARCRRRITFCRKSCSAEEGSTYGTGAHSPEAVQPPRVTSACTCGCRLSWSPNVWTTATMPGRKP